MSNEELVDRIQHGINKEEYLGQLYIQNKGFIFSVVKKFRYACRCDYGSIPIIEMDELMHEAYFGLVEASERFSPDMGNSFVTYAAHWINQAVRRFLDNSGRIIRVPVHMQERIYKYNQVTSYYLRNYNREPDKIEYCRGVGISPDILDKLERFMFLGTVRSLDEVVPGGDDDNLSFMDTVPAEINVEEDIVEKLAAEQLREELWDIVAQVLKDQKKIRIFRLRFDRGLTMEQIGEQLHVSKAAIDQTLRAGIRMLQRNSRTRNLGEELGIWRRGIPLDAERVKRWAADEHFRSYLKGNELKYAANMGWIDSGVI